MEIIRQILIIFVFSLLGEVLHALFPLPVPAGIYGMVLLFAALMTGVLKLEQVGKTGHFLLKIMPLMFIPAAVSLMDGWRKLSSFLVPVLVIMVVSLITVMAATGLTAQTVIQKKAEREATKGIAAEDAGGHGNE